MQIKVVQPLGLIAIALLSVAASAQASRQPAAADLDVKPLLELEQAISRGDFPKTTSVLIMRNGRFAYEHYFGEGSSKLLNNTRSATKFLTALAMGAAIDDRAIPSEHAPAFEYFADLRPIQQDTALKRAITLQDLLTMSSALACDDNDDESPGNENKMHPESNWTRWAVDLPTASQYSRDAQGLGPWHYCTANAFLAGQVVQRATRTPIDAYTERKILQPLGIKEWRWSYSPTHEVMTGGGLELRSRDLAKIAWMVVNRGRWNGQQVVSTDWIDAALTVRRASRANQSYGYFIFEEDYSTACGIEPIWYMAGNGGSQILILRDRKTAIVITRTAYNIRGTAAQTADMLKRYILPSLPCVQ